MKNARIFLVNGQARTRPPKPPSSPLSTLPAMSIGAHGDPHMYIRVTAPDPNNRLVSTQVATWGDNKDGPSGNNELLLVELQTATDTIKVYYTNKNWPNGAKVVANVRLVYNGVSTTYTETTRVVRNPLVLNIFKIGSGANSYVAFEISWGRITNVVKLGGAIVPILKRVADNNGRPWNGGDGLKWDGFGRALSVYGLNRSSFETGIGIQSVEEELVLSSDESNFLDIMIESGFAQPSNIFDNTENLGENGEGDRRPISEWDDTYNNSLSIFSTEDGLSGAVSGVLATTTTTTTTTTPAPNGVFSLSGAGVAGVNGCYVESGVGPSAMGDGPYPAYTNGTYWVWYQPMSAPPWRLTAAVGFGPIIYWPMAGGAGVSTQVYNWEGESFGNYGATGASPKPTQTMGCAAPTTTTTTAAPTTTTTTTTTTTAEPTTTTTTAAPTTTTTTTAPTTTTTTAAPTTTTTTAAPTTTTTAAPASVSSLAVVSGSAQGSGTSISPYLVASDTSPSPIYQANVPGLLTVSFTNIRTGNYNCDKRGCETGRYNESVYFDRNDGNFYEQIRTNIDNFTVGGWSSLTMASRNTLTSISYPMYKGQRLRMSQYSVISNDIDNNRQLTNARISFTPVDSNFSITAIGSRPLFGNGTASAPYCPQTGFSPGRNQRTMVFRANGSGVVAVYGIDVTFVPLDASNRPIVRVGGTSNSFSGSVEKTKLDFFNFDLNSQSIIRPPRGLFFIWVNDGEIFSFASNESDKSGSWIQEYHSGSPANYSPIVVWAVPKSEENGLFLMNYTFPKAGNYARGWQGNVGPNNTPVFWSGVGTSDSPASMDNWSADLHNTGNAATIYTSLNGSISFDYSIEESYNNLFLSEWRTFGVGGNPNGERLSNTNISNNASSGNATINTKAFRGINFTSSSRFRITNLVFTPS